MPNAPTDDSPRGFWQRLARVPVVRFWLTWARRLRERLWFRTLVSAGLAIFFLLELRDLVSSYEWIVHSDLAIADGIRLEKEVLDCETAVRGFLLSHERSYLEPYQTAVNGLPHTILNLRHELRHSSEQADRLKRIDQLLSVWMETTRSLLRAGEASKAAAAAPATTPPTPAAKEDNVKLDKEKDVMDQLRLEMNDFLLTAENQRADMMREVKVKGRRVLITGTALTFLLRFTLLNTARWVARFFRRKDRQERQDSRR